MPTHTILGGKVRLYRRGEGDNWHCSTFYQGREHRKSTKDDSLPHAEEIAEDWYLELRGKARAGLLDKPSGKTFDPASQVFESEYELSVEGQRSPKWIAEHKAHLKNHLRPYFGKMAVTEINGDTAHQYRLHRNKTATEKGGKPPARNTLKNEIITLRLVLALCVRKGWIPFVPNLSEPFRGNSKAEHRAWFSPAEYKALYLAARKHAAETKREEDKWYAEQLYDYILFMGNTGLRPDEAARLEHRDIQMVSDDQTGELILEIEVNRGKRGHGFCKSRPGAVKVYQRLKNRPVWTPQGRAPRTMRAKAAAAQLPPPPVVLPKASDLVFPGSRLKLFNKLLKQAEIKKDRDGKARTAYSIRHTYICMRLTEGANIYELAKNCRTSVEMIQKYYAPHIKTIISAGAINTRRPKRRTAHTVISAE